MFEDVVFAPLLASTIASFIDKLLNIPLVGVLHLGSSDAVTKYDFGVRLARLFGLDVSLISPASVDNSGFKGKRPKNTSLDISKANKILGDMPTIEAELQKFYDTRRVFS
jgi:dTDP-4-dehydrorhamnose reductase